MRWIGKFLSDFFSCLGFLVFAASLYAMMFTDGLSIPGGMVLCPPAIFAWLRGEFYHWPKEKDQAND